MAKDVNGKHISNSNSGNTSPSISDQQKVPPLRIVLNTAGNQKSSREPAATAATANQPQQQQPQSQQQQDIKKERSQQDNVKTDNALKSGGRVRIKLGSGKQSNKSSNSSSSESSSNKFSNEDAQKIKSTSVDRQDNNSSVKEDPTTTNYSHLRRITRRSQRTVQTVSNEDEESISSMTSIDENQSANNINSDNNNSQEAASVAIAQSVETTSSSSVTTTTATNSNNNNNNNNNNNGNSSNADTPRRYKRKRGETSECSLSEHDGLFGFQNYKLPIQNSFELYKNIRKQVDKKLRSLSTIHPKAPYGFRDYMLTRGAYLLDGNKLGNGTNLFMNEDGGLHPAPIGKYHVLRHNRINYSVPNRAKVPLGLPVNSPLYNLFIEQEKERYRMRMQHIKEREKLTLAAEQEIMRVYNQAAMAAANQLEPFSACTMLKHQEIYNYMDSDGYAIQASEDMEQDGVKQGGVRTRRRQHEHISPPPTRKNSNTEEKDDTTSEANQKEPAKSPEPPISADDGIQKSVPDPAADEKKSDDCNTKLQDCVKEKAESESVDKPESAETKEKSDASSDLEEDKTGEVEKVTSEITIVKKETCKSGAPETRSEKGGDELVTEQELNSEEASKEIGSDKDEIDTNEMKRIKIEPSGEPEKIEEIKDSEDTQKMDVDDECPLVEKEKAIEGAENQEKEANKHSNSLNDSTDTEIINNSDSKLDSKEEQSISMEQDSVSQQVVLEQGQEIADNSNNVLSDDDRRAYNKEVFLSQLQDIDDKWDKIRSEMLNRHRHEAESLHAVQKLEWEWKTKEIGACDVRTTLIIDNTLVPKLNIYSQDY